MKISNVSNKAKILLITGLTIILSVGALSYYVFAMHGSILGWSPYAYKDSSGTNPASKEQLDTGAAIKEQSLSGNSTKSGSSGSDQPPAPITQTNGKSSVEVSITAANQTDNSLQVRALISVLDTSGTCTLSLRKQSSDQLVTKTVGVQALANTATCKGFDIPLSELSTGTWDATLAFHSTDFTGSSSQTITIK